MLERINSVQDLRDLIDKEIKKRGLDPFDTPFNTANPEDFPCLCRIFINYSPVNGYYAQAFYVYKKDAQRLLFEKGSHDVDEFYA